MRLFVVFQFLQKRDAEALGLGLADAGDLQQLLDLSLIHILRSIVSSVSAPMSSPLTFFGSVRDRIIATTNTPATGLPLSLIHI